MGCLSLSVRRTGALSVSVEVSGRLRVSISRTEPLGISAMRIPLRSRVVVSAMRIAPLALEATRRDALRVGAYLVCSVMTPYLKVSPVEMQWATEWDSVLYGVESNTDWNVEETNF